VGGAPVCHPRPKTATASVGAVAVGAQVGGVPVCRPPLTVAVALAVAVSVAVEVGGASVCHSHFKVAEASVVRVVHGRAPRGFHWVIRGGGRRRRAPRLPRFGAARDRPPLRRDKQVRVEHKLVGVREILMWLLPWVAPAPAAFVEWKGMAASLTRLPLPPPLAART